MTRGNATPRPEPILEIAAATDLTAVEELLAANGLPTLDVNKHFESFLVARSSAQGSRGQVVGVIGLEVYGDSALLRSLCVIDAERGWGVGRALFEAATTWARLKNVRRLYLLTTTAPEYFLNLGFVVVDRENAPAEIRRTAEFVSLCPSVAVCMRMTLRDLSASERHSP